MSNLTVDQVIQQRRNLEVDILHMIQNFEKFTGMTVSHFDLIRATKISERHGSLVSVELNLEL